MFLLVRERTNCPSNGLLLLSRSLMARVRKQLRRGLTLYGGRAHEQQHNYPETDEYIVRNTF